MDITSKAKLEVYNKILKECMASAITFDISTAFIKDYQLLKPNLGQAEKDGFKEELVNIEKQRSERVALYNYIKSLKKKL